MKTDLSSFTIADKIGIDHKTLIRAMCDMITAGTINRRVLPVNKDGDLLYNREARLSLGDIVALAVHMRLAREVTDSIVSIFARSVRSVAPLVKTHVNHVPLAEILSDAGLLSAIESLRDGTGDHRAIAKDFGVRLVGDALWFGTSTPFLTDLANRGKMAPGQLRSLLSNIEGAVRHNTKKFAGHDSKVVAVPYDALKAALPGGWR